MAIASIFERLLTHAACGILRWRGARVDGRMRCALSRLGGG
jgi:hypothetical protein